MESSTLPDPAFVAASAEFVAVAAHGGRRHDTKEVEVGGRKTERCAIYPNLECAEHEGTADVAFQYIRGNFVTPTLVWADPTGKELFRKGGYRGAEAMVADAKAAAEKVAGKRMSRAEYEALAGPLERAERARRREEWKAAVQGFEEAARAKHPAVQKAAEEGLEALRQRAQEMLDEARMHVDGGNEAEGRALLKRVAEEFPGTEASKKAADILAGKDVK